MLFEICVKLWQNRVENFIILMRILCVFIDQNCNFCPKKYLGHLFFRDFKIVLNQNSIWLHAFVGKRRNVS